MSTTKAVVWNLDTTDEKVTNESISEFPDGYSTGEPETALANDKRKRVSAHDYAPGGKYRSVLKVHVKYNKTDKGWTAGTGWLLKDDLVVTAGHVAYDWEHGRAVSLNTYVGYQGLGSVGTKDVQKRRGRRVVILEEYYRRYNRTFDVALVKLEEPFENVQPFTHRDTSVQGKARIGVVGYPADKGRNAKGGDLGPFMYEEFVETSWALSKPYSYLLQYAISTYGGQSGAPVIRRTKSRHVIGTHIQGFTEAMPQVNSASPIGGQYGPSYNALARVVEGEHESVSGEVQVMPLPPPSPIAQAPSVTPQNAKKESDYAVLKKYRTLFLVDDSESMMEHGPESGTRWETAKSVVEEIASLLFEKNSNGIEMRFFNFSPEKDQRAKLKNLKSVKEVARQFTKLRPEGPSRTADEIDTVLSQFIHEFEEDRETKGLNLIVVTDGEPSDGQDVEGTIVMYAKKLEKLSVPAHKVGIQFVQIGKDPTTTAFLDRLDNDLQRKHGLDRDIVDTVLWTKGSGVRLHPKILFGAIDKGYDNKSLQ